MAMAMPENFAGNLYFFVIALAMLAGGAMWLVVRIGFYMRSERTEGTITGWQPEPDSDSRTGFTQRPVIAFTDLSGRKRELVGEALGPDEVIPLGTSIAVRFDPANPEQARRANWWLGFAGPVTLALFGAVMLAWLAGWLD